MRQQTKWTTWTAGNRDRCRARGYCRRGDRLPVPRGDRDWVLHSAGKLRRGVPEPAPPVPFSELDAHCPREFDPARVVAGFAANGLLLGPALLGLTTLSYGKLCSFGRIDTPDVVVGEALRHLVHPAVLDAGLQSLSIVMGNDPDDYDATLYIPYDIGRFGFHAPAGQRVYCYGQASVSADPAYCEGDLWLFNEDGTLVAEMVGYRGKSIAQPAEDRDALLGWLYSLPQPDETLLIRTDFSDQEGWGDDDDADDPVRKGPRQRIEPRPMDFRGVTTSMASSSPKVGRAPAIRRRICSPTATTWPPRRASSQRACATPRTRWTKWTTAHGRLAGHAAD